MNLDEQSLSPQQRWRYHFISIALVLAFFIAPLAMAKNVAKVSYEFAEGDTIPLALSSININRLVVKNDRILAIVCPKGFCTSSGNQKDASGSITLKINIALPFTAHLTTEKGHLFALFITPKATPALVTEFVWSESDQEQQSPIELAADYPAAMTALTKAMMHFVHDGSPIAGFKRHDIDPNTLPKDDSKLAIIPQTVFVGSDYSGVVYQLKNQGSSEMPLTTAQFYSYSARSAGLDADHLAPGQTTTLYLITGGGAAHVR
ncbi:type-F conjugative transfer system secretin TraK [Vibrio sp. Vb339]|uniref:type-F conjugative transfer system secretin TraK n=1 Tax=Vibrio sp. Vb339 TaxID=1192013 RepID=UPI0015566286|nr:type-F conjugative transfer system secretin TraK [Vibrio sp. Vb339]